MENVVIILKLKNSFQLLITTFRMNSNNIILTNNYINKINLYIFCNCFFS